MDVHGPYLPPADVSGGSGTAPPPPGRTPAPERAGGRSRRATPPTPSIGPSVKRELDAVSRRLGDLYDECLVGLDAELGRFLDGLRDAGTLANTWVVITADHGEHFGEHGHFGHGSTLYNEQTHVPLILIPPLGEGRRRRRSLRRPSRPADRRPGVAPRPPRDDDRVAAPGIGPPASPAAASPGTGTPDTREPPDPVLSRAGRAAPQGGGFPHQRWPWVESLIDEDHVLIESSRRPPELFALFDDPKQERNLADRADQGLRRRRMRKVLDDLHHRSGTGAADRVIGREARPRRPSDRPAGRSRHPVSIDR